MHILEIALILQTLLVFSHINQGKSNLGLLNSVVRMLETETPCNEGLRLQHSQF